jgi:hypothetical protein
VLLIPITIAEWIGALSYYARHVSKSIESWCVGKHVFLFTGFGKSKNSELRLSAASDGKAI